MRRPRHDRRGHQVAWLPRCDFGVDALNRYTDPQFAIMLDALSATLHADTSRFPVRDEVIGSKYNGAWFDNRGITDFTGRAGIRHPYLGHLPAASCSQSHQGRSFEHHASVLPLPAMTHGPDTTAQRLKRCREFSAACAA